MPKVKKTPQRMCIGCQMMKDKKDLVRLVRTPTQEIEVDVTGKKAGRGAYLCRDSACLQKAVKTKRVEKAFHVKVQEEDMQAIVKGWEQIVASKS